MKEMIEQRRSVNYFDPEFEMTKAEVKEVIDLAATAPSTMNLQPWETAVVMSAEMKEKLRSVSFDQPKVEEAAAVIVIIADTKGFARTNEAVFESNIELGYMTEEVAATYKKNAGKMFGDPESEAVKKWALINSSLFAMNLMHSASALGFDSHPMGGFNEKEVKKLLNIDEVKLIPLFVCLGKKREEKKLLKRAFRFKSEDFSIFF